MVCGGWWVFDEEERRRLGLGCGDGRWRKGEKVRGDVWGMADKE